jgi:hypothetical protein
MSEPVPASTYADVFEVDARGQAILEDLVRRFAKPAVTRGGIDAVLQTYQRAGAREVIDFILRRCDQARGVEPADSDDEAAS